MKTYFAIAILGCSCLAAIAFAQKPDGATKLWHLLPSGTCVLQHYDAGTVALEIVDKDAKPEEFDNSMVKAFDEKLSYVLSQTSKDSEIGKAVVEEIERAKSLVSSKPPVIYEVTNVGNDFLVLKPKGDVGDNWEAVPFTAIRSVYHHDRTSAK